MNGLRATWFDGVDKYPLINDNDLNFPLGKEREMLEILGYKMGKTKLELLQIIISL